MQMRVQGTSQQPTQAEKMNAGKRVPFSGAHKPCAATNAIFSVTPLSFYAPASILFGTAVSFSAPNQGLCGAYKPWSLANQVLSVINTHRARSGMVLCRKRKA